MKKANSEKWKACDISQLVNHFHKLKESQYERLEALHLNAEDLTDLFNNGSELFSFDIKMGLKNKRSVDKFSFRPTIKVNYANGKASLEKKFRFGLGAIPADASRVPYAFKEWMTKNWMELDSSLIDDAFVAFLPDKNAPKTDKPGLPNPYKRLLSYHFTKSINKDFFEFLLTYKGEINYLAFHLGIDKNKIEHKDQFNFSPVIEVNVSKKTLSDDFIEKVHRWGLRSFETKKDQEVVYYEYLAPCPSTCNIV